MASEAVSAFMQSMVEISKGLKEEDKLYRYNGLLYPKVMCPEVNFKVLDNFKAREDDIVLGAYPKCGTNWMVAVIKMIMEKATGAITEPGVLPLMEVLGPEGIKIMDEFSPRRFMGTHLHADNIPSSFFATKTKILVILRNPKDALVSYYHFSGDKNALLPTPKSWDSFFSDYMSGNVCWGSYFDYILTWEKRFDDPNILFVTFEELKQDLSDGIRRISTFFGLSLTEAQVEQIKEENTFKALKQTSGSAHALSGAIFRKGDVGDWKNHFTPEQSKEMDEVFNKRLAGTRLGAKLNYQKYCQ